MDLTFALYAVSELAVLLLCVCVFLIIYMRRQKGVTSALEQKVLGLRETIKETKANALALIKKAQDDQNSYTDYLSEQLIQTKKYHATLSPDRDIVLDLDPDVSSDRQAAALRHAFLIAEQECMYAGDEEEPVWSVLQTKYDQIISYYRHAFAPDPIADASNEEVEEPEELADVVDEAGLSELDQDEIARLQEELENHKKRIQNLEKFKRLFFELEGRWATAKREAEDLGKKLAEVIGDTDVAEEGQSLLEQYLNAYGILEESFDEFRELNSDENSAAKVDATGVNKEELLRLREVMDNQHNVIQQLKQKLEEAAQDDSDSAPVLEELSAELEKQERFLKESETCIELLEQELDAANAQINDLQEQLKLASGGTPGSNDVTPDGQSEETADKGPSEAEVDELLSGYVEESREMLKTISALEQENETLKAGLASSDSGQSSAADDSLDSVGDIDIDSDLSDVLAELNMGVEDGADEAGEQLASSDEPLEAEVNELRAKLAEAQQEHLNLQAQYAELEERYLELKMESL